jgi:DNA polymerase delta subunit 1
MDKLMCLINNIEMARVTGVPFSYLLARGQSIRVLSQLYRRANHEGLLVPTYKKSGETAEESYKGAVVIPPLKAFYDKPIATLDFASLYPSIMMAHNLCYSTLISKQVAETMKPEDYTATPAGNYFVKPSMRKGVLPKILEDLIKARNQAKKDMAVETDKFKKDVYNSRQLALKVRNKKKKAAVLPPTLTSPIPFNIDQRKLSLWFHWSYCWKFAMLGSISIDHGLWSSDD